MSGPPTPGKRGLPAPGEPFSGLDAVDLTPRDPRDAMSLQAAWLRSFLAVADKGGFGAATLVLHLSQSRGSAPPPAPEHALRLTLFDLKARPISPTHAGCLFAEAALTSHTPVSTGSETPPP